MNADVVVDIGNTLMKWGRCAAGAVVERLALPHDDPPAWAKQLEAWRLRRPLSWVMAGVQPKVCDGFVSWLRIDGDDVRVIDRASQLSLQTSVDNPDWVGIDRLLNGVAVNTRRKAGAPAIIVSAGTAITVDWLDAAGVFCGGAILPGVRMMTRALHDYTALLPLIEVHTSQPPVPANTTLLAMEAGVFWAAAGGIRTVVEEMLVQCGYPLPHAATVHDHQSTEIFLAGGDGPQLESALRRLLSIPVNSWPLMTLEGIRIAAEQLP